MKKKTFLFLLVFLPYFAMAQHADKIFSEFSKKEHAELVNMRKGVLNCMKPFKKELRGISSMKILDLDECSNDIKADFERQVKDLQKQGYELLVKSNSEDGISYILLKIEKESIKEIVVATIGEDTSLIQIKGNLKKSHIESYASKK